MRVSSSGQGCRHGQPEPFAECRRARERWRRAPRTAVLPGTGPAPASRRAVRGSGNDRARSATRTPTTPARRRRVAARSAGRRPAPGARRVGLPRRRPIPRGRCRRTPGRATRQTPRRGCGRGRGCRVTGHGRGEGAARTARSRSRLRPRASTPSERERSRRVRARCGVASSRPAPRPSVPVPSGQTSSTSRASEIGTRSATANRIASSNCRPPIGVTTPSTTTWGRPSMHTSTRPTISVPSLLACPRRCNSPVTAAA